MTAPPSRHPDTDTAAAAWLRVVAARGAAPSAVAQALAGRARDDLTVRTDHQEWEAHLTLPGRTARFGGFRAQVEDLTRAGLLAPVHIALHRLVVPAR